ncbi:MAG: chaperone NapD [Desulfuromonadaceae bacterium]|nr:chaperone NapD [Desulfuromonadaceae bacterium]
MPIGGFIINTLPQNCAATVTVLEQMAGVEIHATDSNGNIIAVIESHTSDSMEESVKDIEKLEQVLSVGAAYLHVEDEVEKIERGELVPPHPFKKNKKQRAEWA